MMKKFLKLILVLTMSISMIGCSVGEEEVENEDQENTEEVVEEEEKIETVTLTLSFVGDITLGNYAGQGYSGSFDQEYENQGKDPEYFLKNVKSVFESDDLTIANLEGPLTEEDSHADKTFAFKGKPEYVKILTSGGIDAVTLANNHSMDRFQQGLDDTREILTENNIGHFGYAYNYIAEVKGIKIGFLGYSFPQSMSDDMKNAIHELKEEADIVIVYYHWGIERDYAPYDGQRQIAHQTIDEGADLVIGSHPHVLQGIETYNGKKIVYSLSNFCFGGNKNPTDKDSMIYQHTFTLENKEIVEESNEIIPCMISSTKSRNNYQPTIVDGDDAQRIIKKVNTIE